MALNDKPETPEEQERRLGLERAAQAIATDLGTQLPKNVGFAVMLFDFGAQGSFAYFSNARREDMIVTLQDLLVRLKQGRA